MTAILILGTLAVMGVAVARLAARAFDAGHLLVLRPSSGAVWLFERDGDGRYRRLPPAGVPAALYRFACGVPAVERARAGNGTREGT